MYKLFSFPNPETHAHGTIIGIKDEDGKEVDAYFRDQNDAFDYIKTKLENDEQYKNFISHPEIYAKDIYDALDDWNKAMIQKSLVSKYKNQCMYEYFMKE